MVKIADFGLARMANFHSVYQKESVKKQLTLKSMSPEAAETGMLTVENDVVRFIGSFFLLWSWKHLTKCSGMYAICKRFVPLTSGHLVYCCGRYSPLVQNHMQDFKM